MTKKNGGGSQDHHKRGFRGTKRFQDRHNGVSGAQRGFIVTKGFRVVKGGFSHTYPSDQCRMSIVHFIFRQNS